MAHVKEEEENRTGSEHEENSLRLSVWHTAQIDHHDADGVLKIIFRVQLTLQLDYRVIQGPCTVQQQTPCGKRRGLHGRMRATASILLANDVFIRFLLFLVVLRHKVNQPEQ